ncbi:CDC42 small effector protein 1 isoform X1 [Peromyscus maniculatus bairdii]|uniref:CDC42 small effector protein 1 isoform X1 n=1 Tax=Peromyscus maniculatus bairdii TaxID=230844 RepID=UPI003FD12A0B
MEGVPQGLGGRLWPGEEAAAEGSSLGGREALSPHAFSLVCDRVGRRVSPAMQPLLARAEALPAPSLPDSANSKDGFRNTPPGREPRQRLALHPRLASTPPAGWGATAGQLANGPLTQMYGLKGAPARPQNGRTRGGLGEARKGPQRVGRLCAGHRRTRPSADTWGAAGVQERGAPRCPPAGHAVRPGRAGRRADGPGRSAALGSQPRGFRNRVAGVSALGRPHLCRPALDSPPCRAAAREPGVAEPPPAAATAWTPGGAAGSHISRRQRLPAQASC